jgi:branched-chain amino acid transport system substrate-binding protein
LSRTRRAAVLAACVAVAALAAGASGCAAKQPKAVGGDIKIGASLELSGATKSIGTTYQNALNLEVADINKKGVLGGRKLKLIVRDNKTDNAQSVTNVNELVNTDRVSGVILGACSACGVAAAQTIETKKVPTIALGSASALTNPVADRQYMFKISPNPDQDAQVLVDALGKEESIKKIGMLYVNNVYGKEGLTAVTGETAKNDIKISDAETFNPTDTDMSVQVRKITATNPDAIVVWSVMPAAGIIAANIKTAGFKGGVYMDAGAGAELFTKGAQAAADGTFMVFPKILAINDVTSTTPQVTAQKAWFTEYSSKYSTYSGFASFAADALRMMAKAIDETKGTNPQKIRDALETMTFDGYSGLIRNSSKEHSGLQPDSLAILVVRNQEWHLAQ